MKSPTIVWFRRDLRLSDQAALAAAAADGPVVPVYILDDETPRHRSMGAASRWWLHHSLASLDADLREKGVRLILRRGKCEEQLIQIAAETKNAGSPRRFLFRARSLGHGDDGPHAAKAWGYKSRA